MCSLVSRQRYVIKLTMVRLCKGTSVSEVLVRGKSNFTFLLCRLEVGRKSGNMEYGGKEKRRNEKID